MTGALSPTEPGMGYRLIWDFIEENRIDDD